MSQIQLILLIYRSDLQRYAEHILMSVVKSHIKAISSNPDRTAKDDDLLTTLEVCYEFYLRGFEFASMDLYRSHATKFLVEDGKLLILAPRGGDYIETGEFTTYQITLTEDKLIVTQR